VDAFDALVETFKAMGLSEAAAKVAVIGRDLTEAQARWVWNAAWRAREAEQAAAESARLGGSLSEGERELARAAVETLGMAAEEAERWARAVRVREVVGGPSCEAVARELRKHPRR